MDTKQEGQLDLRELDLREVMYALLGVLKDQPYPPPIETYHRVIDLLGTLADRVNNLVDHCKDPECAVCGTACCPYGDEMHFHHDGCPSCAEREGTC